LNKWPNELKSHFSNEEVKMVNEYMKKCRTPLAMGEMQIKTALISISPHSEWLSLRKKTNHVAEDMGDKEILTHC
jgi:hypothetical protein